MKIASRGRTIVYTPKRSVTPKLLNSLNKFIAHCPSPTTNNNPKRHSFMKRFKRKILRWVIAILHELLADTTPTASCSSSELSSKDMIDAEQS